MEALSNNKNLEQDFNILPKSTLTGNEMETAENGGGYEGLID
jgi:hypothetical protein